MLVTALPTSQSQRASTSSSATPPVVSCVCEPAFMCLVLTCMFKHRFLDDAHQVGFRRVHVNVATSFIVLASTIEVNVI